MTEKVYEINGQKFYRMLQSPKRTDYASGNLIKDACTGCAFDYGREQCMTDTATLWRAEPSLLCQDAVYESDDEDADYKVERDYIFVPATHKGMAGYVVHRLEDA